MKKNLLSSTIMILTLLTPIMADSVSDVEAIYTKKSTVKASDKLKQSLNFGFSSTTGNTKTLNLNGKYDMAFITKGYDNRDLGVGFDASLFLTKDENIKNNEEYIVHLGLEQYIWKKFFLFTTFSWLRNEFKNYDNQFSVDVGIGKELFSTDTQSIKIKLGTSYNFEKYSVVVNGKDDYSYAGLTEYIEYNNKLNEISNFYLKMGAMENYDDFSNDYEILAVVGTNFNIAKNLSLTLEAEAKHDSTPAGKSKNDTKTIVRIGYNF